jgi:hypothetical protein
MMRLNTSEPVVAKPTPVVAVVVPAKTHLSNPWVALEEAEL